MVLPSKSGTGATVVKNRKRKRLSAWCSIPVVALLFGALVGIMSPPSAKVTTTSAADNNNHNNQENNINNIQIDSPNNLRHLQQHSPKKQKIVIKMTPPPVAANPHPDHSFLVFKPISSGQGIGNIVAGLLAAHLFGDEFNRIVCVSEEFESFHHVFEIKQDTIAKQLCPDVVKLPYDKKRDKTITLLNYYHAPDECRLRDELSNKEQIPIIYFVGNTYPRWCKVPPNYFDRFYEPKRELMAVLPHPPPSLVVHLRAPDGKSDERKGLDDDSLNALGKYLAEHHDDTKPFLVTNKVAWYDRMEKDFGWRHPSWQDVQHSATKQSWGDRRGNKIERKSLVERNRVQGLQVWSDWYTILRAKYVYHTHSDFSVSAIHWMDTWSKSLLNYNATSNSIDMIEESWRRDGSEPRLVDRTEDELKLCKDNKKTRAEDDRYQALRLRAQRDVEDQISRGRRGEIEKQRAERRRQREERARPHRNDHKADQRR